MELKEYLQIIKNHLNLFISTIAIIILAVFAFFYIRPVSFNTSLTLNISRQGVQNTDQFKYDDFYRLQADEKFVETVSEWLKDPRIVTDIYNSAGINVQNYSLKQLGKSFSPEKLSSQMITINFSAPDAKTAQNISRGIVATLNKTTQDLNKDQKENTWFEIVPQDPVIIQYKPQLGLILMGSVLGGVFIGFWVVMVKHYLE